MVKDSIYYKAMLSRDYRFDGKFFVGVKTTGIYCRPICPAKPKFENVEFFKDSISAEKAGYRPCLRCHPEFAPEYPNLLGKSPPLQKALQLISQNALFEMKIDTLADEVGVSARHLRRLFDEEVGLSPKQLASLHRLNFACKLICETQLELIQVALASGFNSLRRFNDAFKKRYHHPPRLLRKSKSVKAENLFTLHISYRPPFDWKSLLLYYSNHLIPFVEKVTENAYERIFSAQGLITVSNDERKSQLELKVYCEDSKVLFGLVHQVRKMFDLNSDPILIRNQFSPFPFLKSLWDEYPGLRIARGWDPYEVAVGTILGQVVSVEQASRLMGQLVQNYGERILHPLTKEETYLFPKPKVLATAPLEEIKTTENRKGAIRELSRALCHKELSLKNDPKENLKKIKGIGSWSAEYICLRGIGDTNAFPKDDLVLNRALKLIGHHFQLEQIEPWLGYLAIYLWKKYARTKK